MNSNLYFLIIRKFNLALFISVLNILSIQFNQLSATHVVGGQLSYKKLTDLGRGYFEVTLIFRRDCGPKTEPIDSPALLGVFYGDNQKAFKIGVDGVVPLKLRKHEIVPETIDNICIGKFSAVCVEQAFYSDTVFFPQDDRGYLLVYQRCCRNASLQNINDPLETGTTFTSTIDPQNLFLGNSSPDFGEIFPPIYICTNKPFLFTNSAVDLDGDSLVYSLCNPYQGKTKKDPGGRPDFPPYDTITWKTPYSLNNLLGSPFTLNSNTGEMSCIPKFTGQYLVGICVYEYDKLTKKLKGSSRRDFELNVVPCGIKPVASFDLNSKLCDGLKVDFKNQTSDGIDFTWYFDWPNLSPSSSAFNPSYTYPGPGTYEVVLIAKNGDCEDTSILKIKVIDPKLNINFNYTLDCINQVNLQLNDISSSSGLIIKREWKLIGKKDTLFSDLANPKFTLKGDGKIVITLTITDENGCIATISKELELNVINVQLIADSLTICRGDSTKLVKNPDPRLIYNWTPTTSLNLTNPSDPIAKPKTTTTYSVTITDGPCAAIRQITIFVRDKIEVTVSGDTTTCDGKIDLIAKSDTATTFIWSLDPNFNSVVFTGDHFKTTTSGTKTYYIKGGNANQCPDTASITVTDHSLKLDYLKEYTVCTGDTFNLSVINLNPGDQLSIIWLPNPIIIGTLNTLSPTISCASSGKYVLYFSVKNQFDCNLSDSVIINAVAAPIPEFTMDNECGSLLVKVTTQNNGRITWDFGDGIGKSNEKSATYLYKKHGKYIIRLSIDTICVRSLEKEITVVDLNLSKLRDTVISCFGESVQLNPGANPNYHYEWVPSKGLDDPRSPNPTATVDTTTTYYLTVFDPDFPDSCSLKDSITVFVPPTLKIKAESDTTLCEKAKITLRVTSNLSDTEFEWCDEFNHPVGKSKEIDVNPEKSTFYIVKATDAFGCTLRDTVEVKIVGLKSNLADTIISCFGMPVQLNPGGNPDYHYEWTPATGLDNTKIPNPTATTSVSTKYFVTISHPDFPGVCILMDSVCVLVPPALRIQAGPDTTLCEKTKLTLSVTANLNGTEYEWCDENNRPIGKTNQIDVFPEKSTFYIVKAIDTFGCNVRDTIYVKLFELNASLSEPDAICLGDTTFIKVLAGAGTHYKYEWSPKEFIIGSNTDSIIFVNPNQTTTFKVKISNDQNCDWELTRTVVVSNPKNKFTVKADPTKIVPGQKSQLTATYNSGWTYLWSPQDGSLSDSSIYNPVATPLKTTSYTVTVTDENGCTATDEVTIIVNTCFESIFLPNAFSPNGDHVNDTLYVRCLPNAITKMELVIYSRWGEKVFATTDKSIGWDGRFKDEELPPAVYGYGLKFTCHENQELVKKGNISIIK